MRERLWLLLPDDLELPHAAQATLRLIRRRVNQTAARGEEALLEGGVRQQAWWIWWGSGRRREWPTHPLRRCNQRDLS